MLFLFFFAMLYTMSNAKVIVKSNLQRLNYMEDDFMPQLVESFAAQMDIKTNTKLATVYKVMTITLKELTMLNISFASQESYFEIIQESNTTSFLRYHMQNISMVMQIRLEKNLFGIFAGEQYDTIEMDSASLSLDLKFVQPKNQTYIETTVQDVLFTTGPVNYITNGTIISWYLLYTTKGLDKFFESSFAQILNDKLTDYIGENGGSFLVPWRQPNTLLNMTLIEIPIMNPTTKDFVMVFNGTCISTNPNLTVALPTTMEPADVGTEAGTVGYEQVYVSHYTMLSCISATTLSPEPDIIFESQYGGLFGMISSNPYSYFKQRTVMQNWGYITNYTDLAMTNSSWNFYTVQITAVLQMLNSSYVFQDFMTIQFSATLQLRAVVNNYTVSVPYVDFENVVANITSYDPKFTLDKPQFINSFGRSYLQSTFSQGIVSVSSDLIPRMDRVSSVDMYTPSDYSNWALFKFLA